MERRPRDRRRLTTRRRPSAAVTPALADHHRNPHGGKAVLTGPSFVGTGRAGCGRGGSDVDGDGKVDVGWCRVGAVEGDLGGSPSDVFEWHCCRGEPELQAGQRVDVVEAGDGDVLGDLQARAGEFVENTQGDGVDDGGDRGEGDAVLERLSDGLSSGLGGEVAGGASSAGVGSPAASIADRWPSSRRWLLRCRGRAPAKRMSRWPRLIRCSVIARAADVVVLDTADVGCGAGGEVVRR